ncbi:hypothetical protein [Alistipes sp.]|uniref:hypothetical protein n=1 Tax=Alistipes sp. TaxID=1872444 RepID=UPI003AF0AEB2
MKYLVRSLKYFCALCVLCAAIMALNVASGMSPLSFGQFADVLFHTQRGWMLIGVIVLLSAFYPKFGFVVRTVEGDVVRNREQIVNAFESARFSLRSEQEGVMIFRADGLLHKLMLLGEDEIRVSQQGDRILVDGIRRGVARVMYRLDSYLRLTRND